MKEEGLLAADGWILDADTVLGPGWVRHAGGRLVEIGEGAPPEGLPTWQAPPGAIGAPGFVNAHAHLALGALRHLAHDAAFLDWITEGILPAVGAAAEDPEAWRRGALASARELVAGGVTFVGDSFLAHDSISAMAETGLGGLFFHEVFGSLAPDDASYLEGAEPEWDALAERFGTASFGYAPHTPWTCPPEVLRRVVRRARAEGRRLSIHLAESVEEDLFFREGRGRLHEGSARRGQLDRYRFGLSPTALLEELDALGPDVLAVHCVQLDAEDVARLARSGTRVAHCPTSNAKLAVGTAPIAELLEAGVVVGLGTDSVASTGRLDLFEEMRAFLLGQRARTRRIGPATAKAAFRAATEGGAIALGEETRRGRLAPGLAADLQFVRLDDGRAPRGAELIDAFVWTGVREAVCATFVGGRPVAMVGDAS